jgi:hypothetical protein
MALRTAKMATVSGRVIANGKPVSGAWVDLRPVELQTLFFSLQYRATSDKTGHFEITDVTTGNYIVDASYEADENGGRFTAYQNIEVPETGSVAVELPVHRAVVISGSIQGGPGLTFEKQLEHRALVWVESVEDSSERSGAGEVEKDGSFKTNDVSPGTYTVHVTGLPDGWYVQSIFSGTRCAARRLERFGTCDTTAANHCQERGGSNYGNGD